MAEYKITETKAYVYGMTSTLRVNPDVANDMRVDSESRKVIKDAIREKKDIPIYVLRIDTKIVNIEPKEYESIWQMRHVMTWATDKNRGMKQLRKLQKQDLSNFKIQR